MHFPFGDHFLILITFSVEYCIVIVMRKLIMVILATERDIDWIVFLLSIIYILPLYCNVQLKLSVRQLVNKQDVVWTVNLLQSHG